MLYRDAYPVGVKGPSSLCEFVDQQLRPLVPAFFEEAEWGTQLAYVVICVILCERCNLSSPYHDHIRDCSFWRVWKKHRVSKANKEVQSHDISHKAPWETYIRRSAIRRISAFLITFSSNDLSSRLLKIEQKCTIASYFLKFLKNGFLYGLKQLQISNSGWGL